MFSRTFPASGYSFGICDTMIILTTSEALHYLGLWNKSLLLVVEIIDIASISNTIVCCVIVVEINHYRAMFCFGGGLFVFEIKEGNVRDGSV